MSQAEIGNLRVRLGIDTAEFANGVRAVQGSLAGLTSSLKAFATGAAATTLFNATVSAVKAVAEIGDVAESIGVSAEQLQAFQKMAIASGASTDVLTRGLQSIAEQSVDTGSKLAKLFEANGLTVKGKETNQIIREFMDLVRNAASPTEQLAIITGVLGDKVGRQLVEAFRDGAAGADEATRQMVASGNYHTNAEVERLQKLETEYNKIMDRIATGWQKMVVGMVTAASRIQQEWSSGKPSAASELWNWLTGQPVQDWDINTGLMKGTGRRSVNMGPMGGPGQFNFIPVQTKVLPPTKQNTDEVKDNITKSISPPPVAPAPVVPPGTIEDIYGYGEAVSALKESFQQASEGTNLFSDSLLAIGDTITSSLSNALSGLITGTMSVRDAFASMAQGIIQTLSDMAAKLAVNAGLKILLSALGGGGGAGVEIGGMMFGGVRAAGGPVMSGRSYLVGENGPEMFTPGLSGSITPNHALGRGSSPQMNVTVINNSSAQVKTNQSPDGSLRVFIEEAMADLMLRGGNKVDAALARGYGLRRAGR